MRRAARNRELMTHTTGRLHGRRPSGTTRHPMPDANPTAPARANDQDALDPLAPLEARLGWVFHDRALLVQALTHPTYTNESRQRAEPGAADDAADNQRLEFLGDAIVGLCTSELVYAADPLAREGVLTQRRAALVHEARLARAARELGLGAHLRLGRGEVLNGMCERASVLADAFEAVVAAIWCDAGPEARTVISALFRRVFAADLAADGGPALHKPAKARLQEATQHAWKLTPVYAVLAAHPQGPAAFEVEVRVGTRLAARGTGRSRREAEQKAALAGLAELAAGVPEGARATDANASEPRPARASTAMD